MKTFTSKYDLLNTMINQLGFENINTINCACLVERDDVSLATLVATFGCYLA